MILKTQNVKISGCCGFSQITAHNMQSDQSLFNIELIIFHKDVLDF